jgi:uncharacterized protein
MNRVYALQCRLLELIDRQAAAAFRDETLDWEKLHAASCARLAWCLALDRDAEPELAAAAAAIHDIGRIITGRQAGHAEAGYEPARAFLADTGLFTPEEIDIVSLAVKNHSSKTVVGTPIEEIVKDADVIDCYQYGMPFDRPEKETRYNAWLKRMS